ncbi:MAG: 4-(cytidine 5'-diphospho)-2-C-methyl-D-erythritol kinase [Aquabacterium sp.]|nr:MAG: 4-(cytidine 5'-diphospho)-2-C-methyl-D-erythritol kinase [Aquabacterium sp.]
MRALHDLPAPAKLNLFLHVVGRRADGYHLLQSVFVLIDWCDRLSFERRDDGLVRRHDLGVALPADDLCLRAARALQQAAQVSQGVDIHIDKQVPWGAGMGGGSSDAATTLIALNRLWKLGWPRQRLIELATPLGADIPFFLGGHNAWVEGIGEQLTPLPWQDDWGAAPWDARWAVIKPSCSIPTQAIFRSPHLVRDTKPAIVADFLAAARADNQTATGRAATSFGRNDLQPCAVALDPEGSEVTQALELLDKRYGNSRMTGSGSAVFAFAGHRDPADPAGDALTTRSDAAALAASIPASWSARICSGLRHHPLVHWTDG